MKLLIIESDPSLVQLLSGHLARMGFAVDPVQSGGGAVELLRQYRYDALILDLSLPDMDGAAVLAARIRTPNRATPCVVVSEHDSPGYKVRWLNAGADDYVFKPFDFGELEARLRAVLRRTGSFVGRHVQLGNLYVDLESGNVMVDGSYLPLTRKEAMLFVEMLRMSPRVITKEHLDNHLYSYEKSVTLNAIEAIVSRLRRKLAKAGAECRIETAHGIGYHFVAGYNKN